MKKYRATVIITIAALITVLLSTVAFAHPGKTDSKGGHWNRSTGEYHYHHGYSEHDHYDMDGDGNVDCPYDFNDKTGMSSGSSSNVYSKSSDNNFSYYVEPATPHSSSSNNTSLEEFSWSGVFTAIVIAVGIILVGAATLAPERYAKIFWIIFLIVIGLYIVHSTIGIFNLFEAILLPFTFLIIFAIPITALITSITDTKKSKAKQVQKSNLSPKPQPLRQKEEVENMHTLINTDSPSRINCGTPYINKNTTNDISKNAFPVDLEIIELRKKEKELREANINLTNDIQSLRADKIRLSNELCQLEEEIELIRAEANRRIIAANEQKRKYKINISYKDENQKLRNIIAELLAFIRKNIFTTHRIAVLDKYQEYNTTPIGAPSDIYVINGSIPVSGLTSSIRPYGDLTVYTVEKGTVYHSDMCCGSTIGTPAHLFDVIEKRTPCKRCAQNTGLYKQIPPWYKELTRTQK